MKLRSKEINIFSMSALDLFASAMGAFMLLAVMALPFFPNTGDSKERVSEIKQELDKARSKLEKTEKELKKTSEELARVKIPALDLVICLDISGSMARQITGLKSEIRDLAAVLDRLAPSIGIGVVAYGDRVYQNPLYTQPIVKTSSMTELERFIANLKPNMDDPNAHNNNDNPEALDMALKKAISLNWRSDSERRYVIVVTDAPAYPEKVSAALSRASSFSAAGNSYVSTVMVGSVQAQDFLKSLSQAGKGEFVNAVDGQSMISSVLMAILKT